MNVLQINSHDTVGGASKAAHRLYLGLKQIDLQSRMLVMYKNSSDLDIQTLKVSHGLLLFRTKAINKVATRLGMQSIYSPITSQFINHPWVCAADVINLHNIQGNYFAYPVLARLSRQTAVVWTLHDMWGLTGHCGYSFDCERWMSGCGHCPYLDVSPAVTRDTTHIHWRLKKWVFTKSNINIVTPSKWLTRLAQSSPLLGRFNVRCIPNSVDTEVFRPMEKKRARQELNLPPDGFYLLFLASGLMGPGIKRKGGDLALNALRQLPERVSDSLKILLVGNRGDEWRSDLSFPSYVLGSIESEERMALCYAAADAFVLPTRQDNLPNTLLESLACGTPCVSFDVGGVSDAVHHLETGYLAQPNQPQDLAKGITLLIDDIHLTQLLSSRARTFALTEYALHIQAQRYKDLYLSLVKV